MSTGARWRIQGRLETRSLLHVGSGETVTRDGLMEEKTKKKVLVSAVAVDAEGRPYLPGSTLKGVLRSWAARHGEPALVEKLFGWEATPGDAEERGGGGRLIVADAFLAKTTPPSSPPPFWCAERRTAVVPRVAIDRRLGTASHRRLFHLEVVPEGSAFDVVIEGDGLGEDEIVLILAALQGFKGGEIALGAHTGDGWGRMSWDLDSIRRLDASDVAAWIAGGAKTLPLDSAPALKGKPVMTLRKRAAEQAEIAVGHGAWISVELELRFDGPFLVRDTDPERAGEGLEKPDAVARRDADGKAVLPASSFRGALRSRAEKILRTLGGDGAACGVDAPREPCAAVESEDEVKKLCPACLVFGAAGWKAPVGLTDFKATDDAASHRQHFVAVDRFTGGAADKRKFDIEGALDPGLSGDLELELAALDRAGAGPWALALLVLTLRDVVEGDVTFGANAARGYGACRGTIQALTPPAWDALPETLREAIGLAPDDLPEPLGWPEADSPLGEALRTWVGDLETVATEAGEAWERVAAKEKIA